MILKASSSMFLLAAAVFGQTTALMPGTLASDLVADASPESSSSSSFNPATSSSSDDRGPITAKERVDWVVRNTIGPEALLADGFSAGWGTLFNHPRTYGPHWEGYGERFGLSMSGTALSDAMEASIGAIWGEDPRYRRVPGTGFGHRLEHAAKMTFMAENANGQTQLAYARFIAIPSSNFISNTWRAPGDNEAGNAGIRIGLGFLGRFGNNTFDEFWPDVQKKVFHKDVSDAAQKTFQ